MNIQTELVHYLSVYMVAKFLDIFMNIKITEVNIYLYVKPSIEAQ